MGSAGDDEIGETMGAADSDARAQRVRDALRQVTRSAASVGSVLESHLGPAAYPQVRSRLAQVRALAARS
jgi:hypothetical protein